ncbi:MAG: hypothetical protein ACR2FV_02895 [Ornithinimicrobium sp.]|uniref:hypothetical protein n=1 Tax=Ornithinimicrobium sp. TaxID=1977084 RepID=UPI003D9B0D9C
MPTEPHPPQPDEPHTPSGVEPPIEPHVTLLGPQRTPRLARVVDALGLCGPFATINAGWREREPEDELLDSSLGGDSVNLRLWHRMQQVWDADPEFAEADRQRRHTLEELQQLYLLGLDHAMSAVAELRAHQPRDPAVLPAALADAERIIRDMDTRHLGRVAELYGAFWDETRPHERSAVAHERQEIAQVLDGTEAVVLTGGHVGVLLGALHLFTIAPALARPVIAWGAGAMTLTERVVLFHDRATHGPAIAETYAAGLGLLKDAVALPSARDRLDLSDHARMAMLGRRFAPARCLLLDAGVRVDVGPDGMLPAGAPVLGLDGSATELAAA